VGDCDNRLGHHIDSAYLDKLDRVGRTGNNASAASDTAVIIRTEKSAPHLADAVFFTEMCTGAAFFTQNIVDYRPVGMEATNHSIVSFDKQDIPSSGFRPAPYEDSPPLPPIDKVPFLPVVSDTPAYPVVRGDLM